MSPSSPKHATINQARQAAAQFNAMNHGERISLLRRLLNECQELAQDLVRSTCQLKGIQPGNDAEAEEWFMGPLPIARMLRLYLDTYVEVAQHGCIHIPSAHLRQRSSGQVAVQLFPRSLVERALLWGTQLEVWLDEEIDLLDVDGRTACGLRDGFEAPGLCLISAQGDIVASPITETIEQVFGHGRSVLLNYNATFTELNDLYERLLAPLIEIGMVHFVAHEALDECASHPLVSALHFSGTRHHFDESPLRLYADQKRLTAQLNAVSPVIVVPGEWTARELELQAQNLATMMTHNASYQHSAARVLITPKKWSGRAAFKTKLEQILTLREPRCAFRPEAHERHQVWRERFPERQDIGRESPCTSPWSIAWGIEEGDPRACFEEEICGPLLVEITIDAQSPAEHLDRAVSYCNRQLLGSLCATILLDPRTARQGATRTVLEGALESLHFGTVALNHWPGVAWGLGLSPWGEFNPSGIDHGLIHNPLQLPRPVKSIIRGPFAPNLLPPWFCTHRRGRSLGPQLLKLIAENKWRTLPLIALSSLLQ